MKQLREYIQLLLTEVDDDLLKRLEDIYKYEPDRQATSTAADSTVGKRRTAFPYALSDFRDGKPSPLSAHTKALDAKFKGNLNRKLMMDMFKNVLDRLPKKSAEGLQSFVSNMESDVVPQKNQKQKASTKSSVPTSASSATKPTKSTG